MKQIIRGAKLARMQTILATQTDKQRFADKIKERFKDAEEIIVVDPTGINFHYFPRMADESQQVAMSRPPLAILKSLVEQYNAELLEEQPEEEHDLDSVEVLTAHLEHWVDKYVKKADVTLTENDIVEIITVYGFRDLGKFIYHYSENGLLDLTLGAKQKRFSSIRTDIASKVTTVTVTSLKEHEIRDQLVAAVNGDALTDGTVPLLFADDLVLPTTHFKDGQTYQVGIANTSFDYYGSLQMTVTLGAVTEPPVTEPTPATLLTVSATASANTLTIGFNKPVEEIRFDGAVTLAQTAEAPIGAPLLAQIFNASADLTTLSDALVDGLITATTLATSMVINFKDGFFDMTDFELLDTDLDGRINLALSINTAAFANLDGVASTVSGLGGYDMLVQTDHSLTATEPHTPADYAAATAQAVITAV